MAVSSGMSEYAPFQLSDNGLTSLDDTRVISLLSFNRYPRGVS